MHVRQLIIATGKSWYNVLTLDLLLTDTGRRFVAMKCYNLEFRTSVTPWVDTTMQINPK